MAGGKYIKKHNSLQEAKQDKYYSPTLLKLIDGELSKVITGKGINKDDELILVGNDIDNVKLIIKIPNYLCFTAEEDNAVISMTQVGSDSSAYDLQTSSDGIEWSQYTLGDEITLSEGETVYWRGNNSYLGKSYSVHRKFNISNGKVSASGNIMSLLNATEFETLTTIQSRYCFAYLFSYCTSLTEAPELPATTLASYCYGNMFYGCGLTEAPVLPATTLANYCYGSMFAGCTSLTTAPELPATTLAPNCYYWMFRDCTSLTTAPELPATTLADWCYEYIFSGCTSLTEAPELPATTLEQGCYSSMFYNCTSLTTAPELPATTLAPNCYYWMFRDCSKLNYIKVGFTSWTGVTNPTDFWLDDVSSTGTFVKPSTLPEQRGSSYIPNGWTVENVA